MHDYPTGRQYSLAAISHYRCMMAVLHKYFGGRVTRLWLQLTREQCQQLVIIQCCIHGLNPQGVNRSIKEDPFLVQGFIFAHSAHNAGQDTIFPLMSGFIKTAIQLVVRQCQWVDRVDVHLQVDKTALIEDINPPCKKNSNEYERNHFVLALKHMLAFLFSVMRMCIPRSPWLEMQKDDTYGSGIGSRGVPCQGLYAQEGEVGHPNDFTDPKEAHLLEAFIIRCFLPEPSKRPLQTLPCFGFPTSSLPHNHVAMTSHFAVKDLDYLGDKLWNDLQDWHQETTQSMTGLDAASWCIS